MKTTEANENLTASQLISNQIAEVGGWRGEVMARLRAIILGAAPTITEQWKWGTGVWSKKANVVSIAATKDHVKLNFFKGASLDDPHGLFNSGLDAKATRSIDFYEGDAIHEAALLELIRAAVAFDQGEGKR